ncbi:MAG: DMT family transporter [Faecalibacterium sp.]|jgi:drug/metabolite transporter (DMT)-like permease|nr:DMT family transporter [Faecalibacterium sp.]
MKDFCKKYPAFAGALLTLLGGVGWGVSGTCGQYLFTQKGITSLWLVPVRLVVAGLVLLIPAFCKSAPAALSPWKDARDRTELLIYGFAGITLCQLTYFGTIQLSSAGVATILQDLSPILILLWSCRAAHRRPALCEIGSIVLALAGVGLIVTHGSLAHFAVAPAALATGLVCAVSVAVYNIVPARLQTRHATPLLQGWSFLMGGTLLTLLFRPWQYTVHVDLGVVLAFCAVVLLGNVIAFNAYMTGVRLIGPEKGILYGFSEPVTAAALSAVWMGAPFTPWDAAGFAAIFCMLALLSLPKRRAAVNS